MDVQEIRKLDAYLKRLFGNARIRVVPRPKKDDSAEVYIGDEYIGVLFVDDEDGERSYNFNMAILGIDLELSVPVPSIDRRRSQACDEPLDRAREAAPVGQPLARKPHRDVG